MSEVQKDSVNSVKKDANRSSFSLIAGFIVVLILISVVAYRAGIDPKQVKEDVAAFAKHVSDVYSKKGIDVKIEYEAIEVKGGVFEKSIMLQNPSISVKGGGVDYKMSSHSAKIIPLDSYFDELSVQIISPVKIAKGDVVFNYQPQTPLKIDVLKNESTEREYLMELPTAAEIEVDNAGVVRKYNIKNSDNSYVSGTFSPSLIDNYSVSVMADDISLTGENLDIKTNSFSISSISSDDSGEFEMNVVQMTNSLLPQAFGAIDADLVYKMQAGEADGEKSFDVELLSLAGEGFDFNLKGRLTKRQSEIMPIANINVIVNGTSKIFAALADEKAILPKNKNMIIQAIKLIEPEWNEFSLSPLQFEVRREENSPFVIGKVKADELIAMLLQHYFQMNDVVGEPAATPAEPQPQQPDVSEPVAAETPSADSDKGASEEKTEEPTVLENKSKTE
jgi:hypothetical protein